MKTTPETIIAKSGARLSIVYVTVGQHFGTAAQLRSGRKVIGETEVVPYGFETAARERAVALAERL